MFSHRGREVIKRHEKQHTSHDSNITGRTSHMLTDISYESIESKAIYIFCPFRDVSRN